MSFIYALKLFWLDLSRPEVISPEKFILEYQSVFFEVSILLNFVWGNYPLGFESSMLIVVRVREVTSMCLDLFVKNWPFRDS